MTDTDRKPDSQPEAESASDAETTRRSSIEQAVDAYNEPVERDTDEDDAEGLPETLANSGTPDGVAGTGGVTKNQDDMAQ